MKYPLDVYEMFRWLCSFDPCNDYIGGEWKPKIPSHLVSKEWRGKFPDVLTPRRHEIDFKSILSGDHVMFNSTPPEPSHFYCMLQRDQRKIVMVSGAYLRPPTKDEIHEETLRNYMSPGRTKLLGMLSNSVVELAEDTFRQSIVQNIGTSVQVGMLTNRLRSFTGGTDHLLFDLVNENTINLIVVTTKDELKHDLQDMVIKLRTPKQQIIADLHPCVDDLMYLLYSKEICNE